MLRLVLHFRYLTAAGKAGICMSNSNAFSHLTLEERRIILTGIINGSTKTAIAQTIGKDKSTVRKEIRSHCRFDKYQYCPEDAHMDYRTTLIASREGVNLTSQEAKAMAEIITGTVPFSDRYRTPETGHF